MNVFMCSIVKQFEVVITNLAATERIQIDPFLRAERVRQVCVARFLCNRWQK